MYYIILIFGAGLFTNIAAKPAIPSKQEQANVLNNVQEVFEQVTVLVELEGNLTDQSAIEDLEKIIKRAQDKLNLVEELALLKITCITATNSVCNGEGKSRIQKLIYEGHLVLDGCVEEAKKNVSMTSKEAFNMTERATTKGQDFLDKLGNCSNKPTIQQLSCYRKIMLQDVVPVKTMLLDAMNTHKDCHQRVINIRRAANECVDAVLEKYRTEVNEVLASSMKCKK